MNIIEVNKLSKYYVRSSGGAGRLAAALGARNRDMLRALDSISFSVRPGECVGILGRNGSGKSTLLRILAGITEGEGECTVRGTVSAVLELGVGFNPEYSGMRNIRLHRALSGCSGSVPAEKIMDFAEIPEEFRDMPVKTYSSGMIMRLGMAVTLERDADIILIDEALGVGDIRFQAKCFERFERLNSEGRTIIFVSHDVDAVRRLCKRVIWLCDGRVAADGSAAEVTSAYMEDCAQGMRTAETGGFINRYGMLPGSILSVAVTPSAKIGESVRIAVRLDTGGAELDSAGLSVSLKDRYGLDLCVFRTAEPLARGINEVEFTFGNCLAPGIYSVAAGFEDRSCVPIKYYEYIEGASEFRSDADSEVFGLVLPEYKTRVTGE